MAATRTFTIRCPEPQAQQLAEALQVYAHAAYPPGGSECAQVARETLLGSAQTILDQAGSPTGAAISRRQRPMIQAAVDWYFSKQGPGDGQLHGDLLRLLERKPKGHR